MVSRLNIGKNAMAAGELALQAEEDETALASFNEAIDVFFSLLRNVLDPQLEAEVRQLAERAVKMSEAARSRVVAFRSTLTKTENVAGGETGAVPTLECADMYKRIGDKICEEAKADARKFLLKSGVNAYITHALIKNKVLPSVHDKARADQLRKDINESMNLYTSKPIIPK